ncbi:MAG: hypothetical protein MI867_12605 [Pseudomonadales bacterium]|nr:hypothetical protein [Pseudomonadales bacterium]
MTQQVIYYPRRSGRTFRGLLKAGYLASLGQDVYYICYNMEMVRWCLQKAAEMYSPIADNIEINHKRNQISIPNAGMIRFVTSRQLGMIAGSGASLAMSGAGVLYDDSC